MSVLVSFRQRQAAGSAGGGVRPEPGPGQVRIKVTAAGACHSDVFVMSLPKEQLAQFGYPLPMTLGHEGAGVVDFVVNQPTVDLGAALLGLESDLVLVGVGAGQAAVGVLAKPYDATIRAPYWVPLGAIPAARSAAPFYLVTGW